jgi:hypothetical protein
MYVTQLATVEDQCKKWLYNACNQTVAKMDGATTFPSPSPKQARKQCGSWKDKLIAEIAADLTAYENQGMVQFTIDVNGIIEAVKADYGAMSKDEQYKQHQQLVGLQLKTNMVQLLICVARGKLYNTVKTGASGDKKKALADTFLFSPTQAYRYIKFAAKVKKYPRLLACGKSFTEITTHIKVIEEKAEADAQFRALLVGPVYEIKCGNEITSFDECFAKLAVTVEDDSEFDDD